MRVFPNCLPNLNEGMSQFRTRVVATSKQFLCSAFLADPAGNPPSFMVQLNIVKKAKQKGD